jgi:hypothetical protein
LTLLNVIQFNNESMCIFKIIGRDGMIELYIERRQLTDDLLSLSHLHSICTWEKKFKALLSLDHIPSLSLATFVAPYTSNVFALLQQWIHGHTIE